MPRRREPRRPNSGPRKPSVRGHLARNELVVANARLVNYMVETFFQSRPGLTYLYPREDAVSDGFLGLMRAAELYEDTRHTRFSTYACIWIRQHLQRGSRAYVHFLNTPKDRDRIPVHGSIDPEVFESLCVAPEEDIDARIDNADFMADLMRYLPERHARVLRRRLQGDLFRDIARDEGVESQRVQQLFQDALRRLRRVLGTTP